MRTEVKKWRPGKLAAVTASGLLACGLVLAIAASGGATPTANVGNVETAVANLGSQVSRHIASQPTAPLCAPNAPLSIRDNCSAYFGAMQAKVRAQMPSAPPPGGTYLTKAQAIASARGTHITAQAFAEEVPYSTAESMLGESQNMMLDQSMAVWIVTVMSPPNAYDIPSYALPPSASSWKGYTVIEDAATGAVIDYCAGCTSVTSG